MFGIGSLIGTLGGLFSGVLSIWNKKLDHAHELDMTRLQLEAEKESKKIEAEAAIQAASYTLDTGLKGAAKWVLNANALVRPAITGLFTLLTSVVAYFVLVEKLNLETTFQQDVVKFILGMCETCVCWWFGSRPSTFKK